MITEPILKLFRNVYIRYYGKIPKIVVIKNSIMIGDRKAKVHEKTLISIVNFYEWRLKKSKRDIDIIEKPDIKHLELLYKKDKITINALAYILNVSDSSFRKNINGGNDFISTIKIIEEGKNKKTIKPKKVFYPKIVKKVYCPKIIKKPKVPVIKYKQSQSHSYEAMLSMITALIKDSKENLVTLNEDSEYFISSKRFLLNKNGLLEYYLEYINNIDVEECLIELERYALYGYLEELSLKTNNKS